MKRKLVTTLILFLLSYISAVIIIASWVVLIVSLITKSSRPVYFPPVLLLISTIVFIITRIKISKLHKKLDKYSEVIKIITNIVQITGYGYFYSKKYKFKFDTDKIKALDSDNFEIATIPDHWDLSELSSDCKIELNKDTVEFTVDFNSKNTKAEITTNQMYWNRFKSCVSEEEIAKSIEVMRSHNISVIHNILTFSLINGYINGEQRRILLDYGLNAMNNISDDSFKFDRIDEKTGHEIYTFNISTT